VCVWKQVSSRHRVSPGGDERGCSGAPVGWRHLAPALALVLAAPLLAAAQGSLARPRVTDRVDTSRLVTLKGNTHALARAQFDQGAAPADLPMNRIMLVLQRGADQESALQDLLIQQQVNSSPSYRKWLTPDQFGQQFGPADADIQAVTSWLTSYGFQNIKVSKGRVTVEFSGTASQVQAALHTPIHRYLVNGETHFANAVDPQIPAALAPVVSGFASLHNFGHRHTIHQSNKRLGAIVKPGEKPQITFSDGSHGLVPADFDTIYNVTASGMTGAGFTIGIVSDSNINVSDVATFRSMFGLSANPPTVVADGPLPDVAPGSTGEGESVLDATWAGAVAPQANVLLVVSEDTDSTAGSDLSEIYIIDNNAADVMTESFSACESQFLPSNLTGPNGAGLFYGSLAEQAAAQGITYLVASGDGGPDTCDDQSTIPAPDTPASVNILAATPFDIAVGGTEFHDCDPLPGCSDPGTYWNPAAQQGPTDGTAKSYILEKVWNESCISTTSGCSAIGLWSSGGGASIEYGASMDYPNAPPWQTGVTGIPAGNHPRLLPDVSLTAADHDGYVICIDGSCQGTGCPPGASVCFGVASGTSASVQAFGGIIALLDQKVGGRVGNANYSLYKLAAAEQASPGFGSCNASNVPPASPPANTCIFNDVTVGNTNIPNGTTGAMETGFTAGVGYDEATGLGSVNVTNLLTQWHTAVTVGSTTALTLNGVTTPLTIAHGTSVQAAVTVSPATGTVAPTGDVSLIAGLAATAGTGQGADFFPLTPNGTSSSATWPTTFLPGGTYSVHAHYSGDGTFVGSDSNAISLVVNKEASQTLLQLTNEATSTFCSPITAVTYGGNYILTAAVVSSTGKGPVCSPTPSSSSTGGAFPTGQVSITDNGAALGTFPLNSFGFLEDQTIQLTAGSHTIAATYAGDNSFNAGGPVSISVTVAKASTATTVVANPSSPAANTPFPLVATIAASGSNAVASTSQEPTGTVQFTIDGVAGPANQAAVVGNTPGGAFAESTATLSVTLAQGNHTVTALYAGDNNYSASPLSSTTVAVGVPGINVTPCAGASITISTPGQSGTCGITVSAANNFSGNVTLAAVVTGPTGAVFAPTCSFGTQSTIALSSSAPSVTATMTCATTAQTELLAPFDRPSRGPSGRAWPFAGLAVALGSLLFALTIRKQRRWSLALLALLLALVVMAGVSCGGSSSGGSHPGTTTGTYTATVTATPQSGTAVTATVTLNVQ
jgi:trimeric autotransporter adhesin